MAYLTSQVRLTKVEAEDKTALYSTRPGNPQQKPSAQDGATTREQFQARQGLTSHSHIATGVSASSEGRYTLPEQDDRRTTLPDQARAHFQLPQNSIPDNNTSPGVPLRDTGGAAFSDSIRAQSHLPQDSTLGSSTFPQASLRNEGSFVLPDGTRGPRSTPPPPRQDPLPAGTTAADAAATPKDAKRYALPVPTVHSALADKLKAAKVPGLNKANLPAGKQCHTPVRKKGRLLSSEMKLEAV